MPDPKGKLLSIHFWAPRDAPPQFLELLPNVGEDGWVAYIPPESIDETIIAFLVSSPAVIMVPFSDGGTLFAGIPEPHTCADPIQASAEKTKNVR
jgi:hypothetical protein